MKMTQSGVREVAGIESLGGGWSRPSQSKASARHRSLLACTTYALGLALLGAISGCQPSIATTAADIEAAKDHDQCRLRAATLPTDQGVKVAVGICQAVHVDRPALEARKAEEAKAEKMAKDWQERMPKVRTLADVKAFMGEPDRTYPTKCSREEGKPEVGADCFTHEWRDKRPRTCPELNCSTLSFTMETVAGKDDGAFMHVFWPDPLK